MRADASAPKHSTGRRGSTVSGVLTPISRTVAMAPFSNTTSIVSPSTTRRTVAAAWVSGGPGAEGGGAIAGPGAIGAAGAGAGATPGAARFTGVRSQGQRLRSQAL